MKPAFVTPSRLLITARRVLAFFRRIHVSPYHLVLPGTLSVIAAIFEGIGFGLLVPLVRGLIAGGYHDVGRSTPIVGHAIEWTLSVFGERQVVVFGCLVLIVFGSILLKNIFRYYAVVSSFFFVRRFSDNLRRKIYERYLGFGKLYFDGSNAGYLYQVLMEMTERVAVELKAVETAFNSLLLIGVYFVIMTWISWPLTLLSVAVFPIIFISLRFLMVRIGKSSNHYSDLYKDLGSKISNSLACIPLIKAQSSEAREREWFVRASDQVRKVQVSIDRKQALYTPLQEVIMISVILLVVAAMALISHQGRGADVAGYLVFFMILRRSSTNLNIFGQMLVAFAGITGPIREISKVFDDKGKYSFPEGRLEFTGLKRSIRLKDLTFAYPDTRQPLLRGIDTTFERGTTVAIVGGSGGGKTTMIGLLMRFYDGPPGSIFADDVDIRDFTLSSWCSKIALVSQESYLFNASIRTNLIYGLKRDITDTEIQNALEKARLGELLQRLPDGLNSEIGDRGAKLSGGEKQRISIARAILKDTDIVIMDEATSALDSITENLIQEALNELIKNRTTIMVAHRLSTIEHADKVIVLEAGEVVEQGTRHQLLDLKGKFYEYCQKQGIG